MSVRVERAQTAEQLLDADRLVRAYLAELPFVIDFQGIEAELADLSTAYGPPDGALLLAVDEHEAAVGVVGVRRFEDGSGELKRMYVAPAARGTGAGRALAEAAMEAARALGYRRLLLDTVATMTAAIATYRSLGFEEIEAYRHNPLPEARWFALDLT